MTEEKPKVKFKKCINCNGWIPDGWLRHEKCGWNIPKDEQEAVEKKEEKFTTNDNAEIQQILKDVLDIHTAIKEALETKWNVKITDMPEIIQSINCEFIEAMKRLK